MHRFHYSGCVRETSKARRLDQTPNNAATQRRHLHPDREPPPWHSQRAQPRWNPQWRRSSRRHRKFCCAGQESSSSSRDRRRTVAISRALVLRRASQRWTRPPQSGPGACIALACVASASVTRYGFGGSGWSVCWETVLSKSVLPVSCGCPLACKVPLAVCHFCVVD